MSTWDIFNSDAFKFTSLLEAVERVDTKPEEFGKAGIFIDNPVRTETVAVEERDGTLGIIQTSKRGAPLEEDAKDKRRIRDLRTVRIAKKATIYASELNFIRAMGDEEAIVAVQGEIARRLSGPTGLLSQVEATWEYHRLGAVQGVVKDKDGTVIYNYATEFGITPEPTINFSLATASAGALRENVQKNVVRKFKRKAKGARIGRITSWCHENFWDSLLKNAEIRETYLQTQEAKELRGSYDDQSFPFAGVDWKLYYGTDDGTTVSVDTDGCVFVPEGASGIYEVAWSPGETFDDVGTMGIPVYPKLIPDMQRNMKVDLEVYSYPLYIHKRPDLVLKGTK